MKKVLDPLNLNVLKCAACGLTKRARINGKDKYVCGNRRCSSFKA